MKNKSVTNKTGDWEKKMFEYLFNTNFRFEQLSITRNQRLINSQQDQEYVYIVSKTRKFITDLLQEQKQEYLQLGEGMKKELVDYPNGIPKDDWFYGRDSGYNQAIDDFLERIKDEK